MVGMAALAEAEGLVSRESRALLAILAEEGAVGGGVLFHRRPGVAARGRTPKLDEVIAELRRRGAAAARTHFDPKVRPSGGGAAT
jgi:tRNA G26 N,N-dimethylase Trm1